MYSFTSAVQSTADAVSSEGNTTSIWYCRSSSGAISHPVHSSQPDCSSVFIASAEFQHSHPINTAQYGPIHSFVDGESLDNDFQNMELPTNSDFHTMIKCIGCKFLNPPTRFYLFLVSCEMLEAQKGGLFCRHCPKTFHLGSPQHEDITEAKLFHCLPSWLKEYGPGTCNCTEVGCKRLSERHW